MKYVVLALALFLTGCSTTSVPVTRIFPELPRLVTERCPSLIKLSDDVKLSDVAKTVTVNYGTYYDCAVKHDALVEWYSIQKKLFEEGNK